MTTSATFTDTARINTGNVSATTARAADEIQELKKGLTELLLRMERIRNRYTKQSIVVSNYRSTIKRLAGDTASLSSIPSLKSPDSPDMAVSAIVPTEASTVFYSISTTASIVETLTSDENSAFITAPSLRSSSTYVSVLASIYVNRHTVVDGNGQLQPSRDSQSCGAVISESTLVKQDRAGGMAHLPTHEQPYFGTFQTFVKDLSPSTQAIQLEAQASYLDLLWLLEDQVGIPPHRISLYYNGCRLSDTINLPNNDTLQGSVNAYMLDM